MQSRDTSRQFDGILAELNHHKDEIKRLNSLYKKMVDGAQISQKSDEKTKKLSGIWRECGCSNNNECQTAPAKSAYQSYDKCICRNRYIVL